MTVLVSSIVWSKRIELGAVLKQYEDAEVAGMGEEGEEGKGKGKREREEGVGVGEGVGFFAALHRKQNKPRNGFKSLGKCTRLLDV